MAFIIPNATDTGAGLKFVNINQAEPDSLDIEALGNRSFGIRSGGAVTQSAGTITVSGGVAVIKGVPYSFTGSTLVNSAPVNSAFTAILVRLNTSTSTASVLTLNGPDSATNPTLPKTKSTALAFNPTTDFDPDTDVLLATVFRASPTSTLDGHIVDKRISILGRLHWSQVSAPSNAQGEDGDIVAADSTLYLKSNGSWAAQVSRSELNEIVPIGGVIIWPANTSPGARYLECNGQVVSASSFPDLAAAWQVTGSFALPDYRDNFLRGGTTSGTSGVNTGSGGSNTTSVPLKNHSHGMQDHTHGIGSHTHNATVTPDGGSHSHSGAVSNGQVSVATAGEHTHPVTSSNYANQVPAYKDAVGVWCQIKGTSLGGFTLALSNKIPFTNTNIPSDQRIEIIGVGGTGLIPAANTDTLITLTSGAHSHSANLVSTNVTVTGQGTHNHTVTIDPAVGVTTTGPSNNTTTTSGDGADPTISTVPGHRVVRYFVRAY